jgi:geranylgeranyl pyrophosphate synthase
MDKLQILQDVYDLSFRQPRFIAEAVTSGSYAKKVRALAPLGTVPPETVDLICRLVDFLRLMIKIVDDMVDEDTVRDGQSAFWAEHGESATIEQAAWYLAEARRMSVQAGSAEAFEQAVLAMKKSVEMEVALEDPVYVISDPEALWYRIVEKEAAFRRYLAQALGCAPEIVDACHLDGIAAQMLDDGLSALYGKDGRPDDSDERLGRLTYMKAFDVTAEEAVRRGKKIKSEIAQILGKEKK